MEIPYRTQDFVTAVYLTCAGFQPEVERVAPGRVEFIFASTERLRSAVREFRAGDARVSPSGFHISQVELRREMDRVLG